MTCPKAMPSEISSRFLANMRIVLYVVKPLLQLTQLQRVS
jgi:hypothetical protein